MNPKRLLSALRPKQWTKNALVGAAYVFAMGDRTQELPPLALLHTVLAMGLFCLASSAVYLVNDVRDRDLDRLHPTKRYRAIAAGDVPPRFALLLAAVLAVTTPLAGVYLSPAFGILLAAYLVMQVGYTLGLKHVSYLDVLLIATGFVLRALGGAYALPVPISKWLLICTFLLALFLALSKRRHEKVVLQLSNDEARPSLRGYTEEALDILILLVCGATLTSYVLYTLSPDSIRKFGDIRLIVTTPFVGFGIYRYWHLVYRREEGGRPEKVLLTDVPTLANLFFYGIALLVIFAV